MKVIFRTSHKKSGKSKPRDLAKVPLEPILQELVSTGIPLKEFKVKLKVKKVKVKDLPKLIEVLVDIQNNFYGK